MSAILPKKRGCHLKFHETSLITTSLHEFLFADSGRASNSTLETRPAVILGHAHRYSCHPGTRTQVKLSSWYTHTGIAVILGHIHRSSCHPGTHTGIVLKCWFISRRVMYKPTSTSTAAVHQGKVFRY